MMLIHSDMVQVYVQRLGCDLLNGAAVRKVAGIAFPLAMEMLGELPALQFPPSLLAAAILHASRKAQVQLPPHCFVFVTDWHRPTNLVVMAGQLLYIRRSRCCCKQAGQLHACR